MCMCVCVSRQASTGTVRDPVVRVVSGSGVCCCGWCLEKGRVVG
jgi:hypothetical protein